MTRMHAKIGALPCDLGLLPALYVHTLMAFVSFCLCLRRLLHMRDSYTFYEKQQMAQSVC